MPTKNVPISTGKDIKLIIFTFLRNSLPSSVSMLRVCIFHLFNKFYLLATMSICMFIGGFHSSAPQKRTWIPISVWSSSPRDCKKSSIAPQFEGINSSALRLFYCPALTSICDNWKNNSFDNTDLCRQMSQIFNMLSRFLTAFLLRSKCFLISWLQSLSTVIFECIRK